MKLFRIVLNPFGIVHKRRPQSGGEGLYSIDKEGGFFRCGRPYFCKFMVCPHARGWASADIFQTRRGGQFFCDFVRTSFMDSLLLYMLHFTYITVHNTFCQQQ